MSNPAKKASSAMTVVGVISDTHSLLRPEAIDYLRGSDLIIHAGDIGSAVVVNKLEQIAPVLAIRGNIDKGQWAKKYPETEVTEIEGKYLYVLHNLNDLSLDPVATRIDVVISGHSHLPKVKEVDGVLYLNPGSAGPRRFKLPIALAKIIMSSSGVSAEIHEISK